MIVYIATNYKNGKSYVGQTGMSLRKRFYKHTHDAKNASDSLFHRAIRKHGMESFDVQTVSTAVNQSQLNNLEKVWVILLQSDNPLYGYNLTAGGEGGAATPEIRQKMRDKKLNDPAAIERMKMLGQRNIGRKASSETRKLLSIATSGESNPFFGRKHTPETKEKIRESRCRFIASGDFKPPSYWKGKKFSEEHKEKLRVAMTNRVRDSKGRVFGARAAGI